MDRCCPPSPPPPLGKSFFFSTSSSSEPAPALQGKVLIWAHLFQSISLKFIMEYQWQNSQESHYGLCGGGAAGGPGGVGTTQLFKCNWDGWFGCCAVNDRAAFVRQQIWLSNTGGRTRTASCPRSEVTHEFVVVEDCRRLMDQYVHCVYCGYRSLLTHRNSSHLLKHERNPQGCYSTRKSILDSHN